MGLYLVESFQTGSHENKESFEKKLVLVKEELFKYNVQVIEVQVSRDFSRIFFIFESEERSNISEVLRESSIPVSLIKEVRLVGKELDEVKRNSDQINYLVEWNLPEGLTMEKYLERKKNNSVYYAEVPEVAFTRTYVCEDMTKCLCFYDAPDEAAIKKAREAVKAPIDMITEILPNNT
jgi:hypothetical protein